MNTFTLLLISALLVSPLVAQEWPVSGSLSAPLVADPDDRYWDSRFGGPNGLTGEWYSGVTSIVRSDIALYVAGRFTHAGGVRANNIARYDGTRWHPLVSGTDTGTSRPIAALASYRGDLFAGGSFDSIAGAHTGAIGRWDGTMWHRVGSGLKGEVLTMLALENDLYVGGTFEIAGSGERGHVAHWSGSQWQIVGGKVNGSVRAIALHGGTLCIGGVFDTADGIRTGPVAWWAPGSGQWRPLAEELRDTVAGAAEVWALASDGSDLYAGGRFDRAGDRPLANIARLSEGTWESLGDGLDSGESPFYPPSVLTIATTPTEIFAGGTFGKAGARVAGFIARWDRSSKEWKPLGSGVSQCEGFECATAVSALLAIEEDLLVGGSFLVAGEKPSLFFARWRRAIAAAPSASDGEVSHTLSFSPTPFNGATSIRFTLVGRANVRLSITDIAGRELAVIVDAPLAAGDHHALWDASAYPAGAYICRLEANGRVVSGKILKGED